MPSTLKFCVTAATGGKTATELSFTPNTEDGGKAYREKRKVYMLAVGSYRVKSNLCFLGLGSYRGKNNLYVLGVGSYRRKTNLCVLGKGSYRGEKNMCAGGGMSLQKGSEEVDLHYCKIKI